MKYEKTNLIDTAQAIFFNENGYLLVKNLLTSEEVIYYQNLYEDMLSNKIDMSEYRSDLSGQTNETAGKAKELITQIMVPGRVFPQLLDQPLHQKSTKIAKELLGNDMTLDFDMLIDKAPYTNTPTPWHQDRAYWISMTDNRAVSCWVALDQATKDNGCMWYVPGSHKLPVRLHRPTGKGGALQCDAEENEGIAVEIEAGDCVFHHGGTLHYSRGNSTSRRRRAFITNFRPEKMVEYMRKEGYDHTGTRQVKDTDARDDSAIKNSAV